MLRRVIAALSALAIALPPLSASAGLIRDAEIESTLRAYSDPIFISADIPSESVRIFIVDSPQVNAFVAGGLNMFLHTGLILHAETPEMLIGVIAHETGHIAGAHLSQMRDKSSRASLGGLLGALLGAAAAASGAGNAGAGIIAGSQQMAARGFLSDIRRDEQSADHAALRYLDENGISSEGMLAMFELLRRRETGGSKPDPYLLTHPLSSDRIATMRNHLKDNPRAAAVSSPFTAMHARMQAKLIAFTEPYERTLIRYPATDSSVAGRYARAIAEFRRSRFDAALEGIDALIKQSPKDPYFYDTKGQILFESGRPALAAAAYAKASNLKPNSALILTDYARALIAQEKPELLAQAIALLERARTHDDSYAMTWRQLAIAYGKQGKLGQSYRALAEESALTGDFDSALQHLLRARNEAGSNAALAIALDDLERDIKNQRQRKKDKDSLFLQ